MKKYNSRHESGHVIGKAEKYWTWWVVSEPQEKPKWYGTQLVQYFNYQQNLSFDKDKAIQKMKDNPDVDDFVINEGLRSYSSYSNELSIDYNEDVFLFGKYKKKKFSDVDDTDYKRWYWQQTKGTDKESDVLRKQLDDLLIEYDGDTIFIDDLKEKAMKKFEENFRKNGHFGEEGDEFQSYVRFRNHHAVNSHYGVMNIYQFVTPDGELVYYKGSKELNVEEDVIYQLKGKIGHEEYYSNYHSELRQETKIKYPKIKIAEVLK